MGSINYNSTRYKKWRAHVFKRDKYTCRLCDSHGTLNAHHILRKADRPDIAFELSNGITLCEKCHHIVTNKEHIFAPLFIKIINKTIDYEFLVEFFKNIFVYHLDIVSDLKEKKKIKIIPKVLSKLLKKVK